MENPATPTTLIARAIARAYPGLIETADGTPYTRPSWTDDTTVYRDGFYWQNGMSPPDRFYFDSFDEAAEDVAMSLGFDDEEAERVLAMSELDLTAKYFVGSEG